MLFSLINIEVYFNCLNIINLSNDFTQHYENILNSILMKYWNALCNMTFYLK